MKNSARPVQPVVPADTCGSKGSERSCEPAVPAEGASLRAALLLARTAHERAAINGAWNEDALRRRVLRLERLIAAKRTREAPGGNRELTEGSSD